MGAGATMNHMHAVLTWQAGLPYSCQFDDVYFSVSPDDPQHGLAETRHVFIQHNQLASRWAALRSETFQHFTIIETGFGSGLNFLATVDCWLKHAPVKPPAAHLHFVSIEIAPFCATDLARALQHFPALSQLSTVLLAQYQLLHPGINQFEFPEWGVSLTLGIGDVATVLPTIQCQADAWFLDGFAPSKNPDMWQEALFSEMARLSKAGTTFATFTSAGKVRRGLQAAGFHVQKVSGYGAKREMLCGVWPTDTLVNTRHARHDPLHIAIIGAGIAGASTAWHLAQLGCKVTVFERQPAPAMGASGNPYGMLYPRLNSEKVVNDTLALQSYAYTLRHYARLLSSRDFQSCGLLQLGGSPRELKRVNKVSQHYSALGWFHKVSAAEASELAGVPISHEAIYFPQGAWVNPVAACQAMLQHPLVTLHCGHRVDRLQSTARGWHCIIDDKPYGQQVFDAVVIANAVDASQLLPTMQAALQPIRGQMSMIAADAASQPLKRIICGDGYLTPAIQQQHALGATFHPRQTAIDVTAADNQDNLAMMQSLSPQFAAAPKAEITYARASLRCGTRDYLPCVGPIPPLAHPVEASHRPHPSIFCHVGHGSKGLLTAPYCAAILAREILNAFGEGIPQIAEAGFYDGLRPLRHAVQSVSDAMSPSNG